jgi:mitochondrial import inner membrane translocase subunit TIM50
MAQDTKRGSRFAAPSNTPQKPSRPQEQAPSAPASETAKAAPEQSKAVEPEADKTPEAPEKEIPLSQLPDLTQGIPSTFAYEQAAAQEKAALQKVEGDAPTSAGGGRGKGELPASAYISSTEKRRQRLANYFFAATLAGIVGGVVYLGRNWDEEEERKHPEVPNGWGLGLWWNRASTRMSEVLTYYHEPAFEKLLPDPDPMFERPYTLCISLEDMLVHSEWTREHGWRLAKRPGADYFLHYLSQYYELVLFTSVPFAMGEPLVRKLDPYRFIVWPLFREATKYKDGEVVKVSPLPKTHV